jgi:hypothetical protein
MNKNPGLWIFLTAGVVLWQLYDISSRTEEPSRAVAAMQWIFLICAALGCVGAVMQYLKQKREGG